jgi:hypothetical protein
MLIRSLLPPRYVLWVFWRTLLPSIRTTFAMLLLFSFFDLISQADKLSFGIEMFRKILIRAPANLYELLPFSVMLSSIIASSQWMQHSEWTILRFAGWKTRHNAIIIILSSLLLGNIGLWADRLYAQHDTARHASNEHVWVHHAGYIFNIEKIILTSSHSAIFQSLYIYPDTLSVLSGNSPHVYYVPEAILDNNQLILSNTPTSSKTITEDLSLNILLPSSLSLPFYLILAPQTLENLDILFLAHTVWTLHQHPSLKEHPTQRILEFSLIKKAAYPFWLLYWTVWGSLVLKIPARFKHIRLYQAGLFTLGSLLIFSHRSLSPVLMQQGISGSEMNLFMFGIGILLYFGIQNAIRSQTQARG